MFRESFLSLEAVKALGITKQSLDIALDRLTATRDRETQRAYVDQILQKASDLQKAGDTKGALELLSAKSKEAETLDKTGEFKKLLAPYTEDKVKSTLAGAKDSLDTGYTIGEDKIELPSGALSIFSAPTSHGKTSLLINLLLQVAKISPEKEFYLFSYEESGEVILLKTLNTFLDIELSKWNRRTLQSYFKTGEDTYIKPGERKQFYAKKEQFFTELIDTKRVNIIGSSFNSDTLIEAIRFLNKEVNLGGVFIDYFQLLNLPESRLSNYGSRQTELKEICINLKDLAVETGLPITLGAQFNREVTSPRKIHPTRIGEAGDIERIANLLIGFWNTAFKPALDGKDSELTNVKTELGLDLGVPGTLFLEVMKNRDGVAGIKDTLLFNGNTGKISNRAPDIDLF
jgi:replicative DNA helicase